MTTFTHTMTGTYWRSEVPPRCRKPRDVGHTVEVEVEVPDLTGDDAPVAIRHTAYGDRVTEWRWWDGRLFGAARCLPVGYLNRGVDNDEQAKTVLRRQGDGYVLIDGQPWEATDGPVWYPMTFGLGGNHGGTSLCFGSIERADSMSAFRADEATEAADYTVGVALHRGDNRSVERIRQTVGEVEILIPAAISGPTNAERVAVARDVARRKAREVADMLIAAAQEGVELPRSYSDPQGRDFDQAVQEAKDAIFEVVCWRETLTVADEASS